MAYRAILWIWGEDRRLLLLVAYQPQCHCGVAHCDRGGGLLPSLLTASIRGAFWPPMSVGILTGGPAGLSS